MNKIYWFFLFSFVAFSANAEVLKESILNKYNFYDKSIRNNYSLIKTESNMQIKIKNEEYSVHTYTNDYVDSIKYVNVMTEISSGDSFISSAIVKTDSSYIMLNVLKNDYMLVNEPSSVYGGHNFKQMLPDTFVIEEIQNRYKLASSDSNSVIRYLEVDKITYLPRLLSINVLDGKFKIRILSYHSLPNGLFIPKRIEIYSNDKLIGNLNQNVIKTQKK